jgi:hypothetical protein
MPRENSFSDSEGRSLTPDLSDEESAAPEHDIFPAVVRQPSPTPSSLPRASKSPSEILRPPLVHSQGTPKDRFRASVKKVIQMQRTTTALLRYGGAGAEPGADPRRSSAFLTYGHIKQNCVIELIDYSTVRASSGRMTNNEFVKLLNDETAGTREPWVKVRWINICGISWDVISALAIHYGKCWCLRIHLRPVDASFQTCTPWQSKTSFTNAGRLVLKQITTQNTSSYVSSATPSRTPILVRLQTLDTYPKIWTRGACPGSPTTAHPPQGQ